MAEADLLITVADRLKCGHFIGVLADRNVDGKDLVRYPFLGGPAAFPQGPFRVAMLLQRPVVMMVGIYRGGNRYEVFFETLAKPPEKPADSEAWLDAVMRNYVPGLNIIAARRRITGLIFTISGRDAGAARRYGLRLVGVWSCASGSGAAGLGAGPLMQSMARCGRPPPILPSARR